MRLRALSVSTLLALAASTASAEQLSVKYPDLLVSDLKVAQTPPGITVAGFNVVSFTVKEGCGVQVARTYHIAITIAPAPGAAALMTKTVLAMPLSAGGSQKFSVALAKGFPLNTMVRVDADSKNEIAEDVEDNNYRQLNPNTAPFPPNPATYCKPHAIVKPPQP